MRKQVLFFLISFFLLNSLIAQTKPNAIISVFYGPYFQTKRYGELQYWGNQFGASAGILIKNQNVNLIYRSSEVFTKLNAVQIEKRNEIGINYGLRFFDQKKFRFYTLAGLSYGRGVYQQPYIGNDNYNYVLPQLDLKLAYQVGLFEISAGTDFGYYYRVRENNSFNPILFYPYLGLQLIL